MVLSSDPEVLKKQLRQLIERSNQCLLELKAPIILFPECDYAQQGEKMYGKGGTKFDYNPPTTRFAKLSGLSSRYLYEMGDTY